MRVITICMAVAVTVLAGCGSHATKESSPAPTPVAPAKVAPALQPIVQAEADDDEVVCRKEKLLGTRIGKRVCKTRAQFKLEEESARQMMKNRDQKSHGVTDPITGGN